MGRVEQVPVLPSQRMVKVEGEGAVAVGQGRQVRALPIDGAARSLSERVSAAAAESCAPPHAASRAVAVTYRATAARMNHLDHLGPFTLLSLSLIFHFPFIRYSFRVSAHSREPVTPLDVSDGEYVPNRDAATWPSRTPHPCAPSSAATTRSGASIPAGVCG